MNKDIPLFVWKKNKVIFKNKSGLPSSVRCVFVGPSGRGKTQLLLRMLVYSLDFNRLIICSPTLTAQIEYRIFVEALKAGLNKAEISAIFYSQDEISDVFETIRNVSSCKGSDREKYEVIIYKESNDLPTPEELRKEDTKTLVIIDDCMTKNQKPVSEYFVYSRPLGINICYLTQSFFRTDKQCTRDNANILIFFTITPLDLQNIYRHIANREFDTLEKFKQFAEESWSAVKDRDGKSRGYFVFNRDAETFRANCF